MLCQPTRRIPRRLGKRPFPRLNAKIEGLVAIILIVIGLFAIIQSRVAVQQRGEANRQRLEAVRQRNIALARYLASEGCGAASGFEHQGLEWLKAEVTAYLALRQVCIESPPERRIALARHTPFPGTHQGQLGPRLTCPYGRQQGKGG